MGEKSRKQNKLLGIRNVNQHSPAIAKIKYIFMLNRCAYFCSSVKLIQSIWF